MSCTRYGAGSRSERRARRFFRAVAGGVASDSIEDRMKPVLAITIHLPCGRVGSAAAVVSRRALDGPGILACPGAGKGARAAGLPASRVPPRPRGARDDRAGQHHHGAGELGAAVRTPHRGIRRQACPHEWPPARVVALHDHSAFKYYGKEKLVAVEDEPPIMKEFKQGTYGGVFVGHELARRGFVVVVPDNFLWGSRKLPGSVPEEFVRDVVRETPAAGGTSRRTTSPRRPYETLVAKTSSSPGTTWTDHGVGRPAGSGLPPTRSDTDGEKLGCGGLPAAA